MKHQIQCPNCHGFKVNKISGRHLLLAFGGSSIFVGLFLAVFIIGIPFLVLGIMLLLTGAFVKDSGKRRCTACGRVFYELV